MRAAVVQNGLVLNVIRVESLDQQGDLISVGLIPPDAVLVETLTAGPGWSYDGKDWTAPPEPEEELPQPPEPEEPN
jgi:hypothetical protein